jgi:hypothetical protein
MRDDRLCPACFAGRLRVRTSKRLTTNCHRQYIECVNPRCNYKTDRVVEKAKIRRRLQPYISDSK